MHETCYNCAQFCIAASIFQIPVQVFSVDVKIDALDNCSWAVGGGSIVSDFDTDIVRWAVLVCTAVMPQWLTRYNSMQVVTKSGHLSE